MIDIHENTNVTGRRRRELKKKKKKKKNNINRVIPYAIHESLTG